MKDVQDNQLYKSGKSILLKNWSNKIPRGKRNSAEGKNLFNFLGAQKSKVRREALETPNKLWKTFRDVIETLSTSDCIFSIRETQILTIRAKKGKLGLVWHLSWFVYINRATRHMKV
jgi:hypothetical protein